MPSTFGASGHRYKILDEINYFLGTCHLSNFTPIGIEHESRTIEIEMIEKLPCMVPCGLLSRLQGPINPKPLKLLLPSIEKRVFPGLFIK